MLSVVADAFRRQGWKKRFGLLRLASQMLWLRIRIELFMFVTNKRVLEEAATKPTTESLTGCAAVGGDSRAKLSAMWRQAFAVTRFGKRRMPDRLALG
jgi:hypothetical protein